MKPFLISILVTFFVGLAHAESTIYVCVNERGLKTFGNVGSNKGCKKVELPGLTTFPVTKTRRVGKTASKTPNDFPRVDDSKS